LDFLCTSDGYYEWCKFQRYDGKLCDFEWKREVWNLTTLQCSDFESRFIRTGLQSFEVGLLVKLTQLPNLNYEEGFTRVRIPISFYIFAIDPGSETGTSRVPGSILKIISANKPKPFSQFKVQIVF
jgi:hypothetical protein